jgi:hypothetical protein
VPSGDGPMPGRAKASLETVTAACLLGPSAGDCKAMVGSGGESVPKRRARTAEAGKSAPGCLFTRNTQARVEGSMASTNVPDPWGRTARQPEDGSHSVGRDTPIRTLLPERFEAIPSEVSEGPGAPSAIPYRRRNAREEAGVVGEEYWLVQVGAVRLEDCQTHGTLRRRQGR